MRILNLSLDKLLLEPASRPSRRIIEYGNLVEQYEIIVPSGEDDRKVVLTDKLCVHGVGGKNKLWVLLKIYWLAGRMIKENRLNIISVQDQYWLGLLGWFLAKKFSLGLEIQVHGFEKFAGWRRSVARFVLPRANSVRTVSQRLKKQLIEGFGVKEKKITVVPIFIEREIRNSKFEIRNKEKFIFLTVGRLVPIKNIGLQIEAMVESIKKYPGTELWIAGDGPEEKSLKVKVKSLKLEDRVRFLGRRSDVDKFYNQADAFLLTSNAEGWPLVIIEAASHGLPIIMTDVGSAGELIKHRESGLIIKTGDLAALKQATQELISDDDLRKRLGEGARAAIAKLPSKEEFFKLYKSSWEKALS